MKITTQPLHECREEFSDIALLAEKSSGRDWVLKDLRRLSRSGAYITAIRDCGRIVSVAIHGKASLYIKWSDIPDVVSAISDRGIHLYRIACGSHVYTDPEYNRQGLATQVFEARAAWSLKAGYSYTYAGSLGSVSVHNWALTLPGAIGLGVNDETGREILLFDLKA